MNSRNKIPLIAIGISAGGLEALESFFKSVPKDIQAAIVIVQHLDPDHQSILHELISKFTDLDTVRISEGMDLKLNKIFVIPHDKDIMIRDGKFILENREKSSGGHFPINKFFISVKDEYAEKSIGVILSGAGSDGTEGLIAIKETGGLTMVQEPSTALYDGMPNNAIDTGMADIILAPDRMFEKIADYIECEFRQKTLISINEPETPELLKEIFYMIKKHTGHDFSDYKISTICRRIERRIVAKKILTLKNYVELLRKDTEEIITLYSEFLINVTGFYRDKKTFRYIEDNVIEEVISSATDNKIRVWVPACSTGEEAYTWAIMFRKYIDSNRLNSEIQIFASDIDTDALEKARDGKYSPAITDDLSDEILEEYFIKHDNCYEVKKSIREMIIFAEQNILQDPPYSRLTVVSCRNFLIYLNNSLQQKAISIFHYSLKTGGYLLLGDSESLGNSAKYFSIAEKKFKLFKKIESESALTRIWDVTKYQSGKTSSSMKITPEVSLSEIAKQTLLDNFSPTGIIINHNADILYVQGRTGKFLELSTGQASYNIISTAREGLKLPLANAITKAKTSFKEVKQKRIKVKTNGDYDLIDITVHPVKLQNLNSEFILVVFEESCDQIFPVSADTHDLSSTKTIGQLEKELQNAHEYLQSTVEELESANEELKSANEEAQSTNEELQSSNEELETSKEELQSLNEELLTTNYELQYKVKELTDINNDIKNLLGSTNIATVFLDKQLKIFRFTPCIKSIFELIDSDIGRSISHFHNNLDYGDLTKDAREVLRTLVPVEREVGTTDGNFYLMRMMPYRTVEDKIEGLVITFTDITLRKKQDIELNKYRDHLEEMVKLKTIEAMEKEEKFRIYIQNSPTAVFVVNGEGRYTYVNESGMKLLGYNLNELVQKSISDISKEGKISIFKRIKKERKINGTETEWKRKDGSLVSVLVDAVKVSDDEIIAFAKDISEIKETEAKLEFQKYRAQHYLDVAGVMILALDKKGNIILANKKCAEILEYDESDLPGKNWFDNFIPKKMNKEIKNVFSSVMKEGMANQEFYKNSVVSRSGEEKIIAWYNSLLKDEKGNTIGILSSGEDVTEKEKAETELKHLFKSMISAFVLFESVFDKKGNFVSYRFLYVNDAYENITGVKNDEVLGKTVHEVWPDTEPEWIKRYGRTAVTGKPGTFELYHDPTKKLYHCNVYRPWNNNKKFCVILEDITERKANEQNYRLLFSNIQSAFALHEIITDKKGKPKDYKFIDVNAEFENMTGLKKADVLGKRITEIFPGTENDPADWIGKYGEIAVKGGEERFENYSENLKKWFKITAYSPQKGQFATIFEDITERKSSEDKLKESNRDLEEFAYLISHDLKEPLRTISGFAKLLKDNYGNELDKKAGTYLDFISDGSAKMHKKIQDVLEFSKVSNIALRSAKTDLNIVFNEAKDNLSMLIKDSRAIIVNRGLPEIYVDRERMVELFQNLLSNAMKYSKDDIRCRITVSSKYEERSKEWTVSLKDNGIGISKKDFNKIFVVFKRPPGSSRYEGSGVGLAVCKRIVELHNGRIWIESEGKNKGSVLKFTLKEKRKIDDKS